MPLLSLISAWRSKVAISSIAKLLTGSTFSKLLQNFKAVLLRNWKGVLLVLISIIVGFRIGWIFRPPEYVEVVEQVPLYDTVVVERLVYRIPPLPECAGFDFDPHVGGMNGSELIKYTAEVYNWGARCSTALATESEKIKQE